MAPVSRGIAASSRMMRSMRSASSARIGRRVTRSPTSVGLSRNGVVIGCTPPLLLERRGYDAACLPSADIVEETPNIGGRSCGAAPEPAKGRRGRCARWSGEQVEAPESEVLDREDLERAETGGLSIRLQG